MLERRSDVRCLEAVVSGVAISITDRTDLVYEVFAEAHELCVRKHSDYGDAVAEHGPVGVLVRIHDKLNRLKTVSRTSITLVSDESMRDTLIDLINYAGLAVTMLDENRAAKASEG